MDPRLKKISKFLSLVLRHKPETIGLTLDRGGWVDVDELLGAFARHGHEVSRSTLLQVVETNDKSRFAIRDGLIRASQGHSIDVDLGLVPRTPPDRLFHGTATRFLESIRNEGLKRQNRQFVHLSPDNATAISVGGRHGRPVVLIVNARAMEDDGCEFYYSENGVWLVSEVAPHFIEFPITE
ncbi:MAG: RNA 2'-phosphotransferase [Woeseiaceae bacterium]|nr:RNA 2'-phosphotransferase [Woeseiaceae bacterium]